MRLDAGTHAATAARLAAAALAAAGLFGLAACEQRPEPRPAYAAAPPPPAAPLAGEPDAAPTAAPPPAAETDAAPPPEAEPASPPTTEPPPPSSAGPAPTAGLVAMAPIPNPEDGGPAPPAHPRVHHRYAAAGPAPYAPAPRPRHRRMYRFAHAVRPAAPAARPAPPPARPAVRPARPAPPATVPHAPSPHTAAAPKPSAPPAHERRATPAELGKAQAGHKGRHAAHAAQNAAAGNAQGNGTGADASARAEALRSALSAALARGAVLNVPKVPADGAADVTLTVPAGFYDTVQTEAGKQALGDAAASVNLDATLAGEGWSILPAGPQSQPLHAGQPTVFHWTVSSTKSAGGGEAGPLHADVSADLLGGGAQTLALGTIDQHGAGGGAGRWWGLALLGVVVALGLGFMVRSRAAARPARRRNGEIRRPFDMTNGNGDYRP